MKFFLKLTAPVSSIILSLLATWTWIHLNMPGLPENEKGQISFALSMGTLAQISATMLGFMMAVLAILASISNTRLIRNMQRSGHYHVMLKMIFINNLGFTLLTFIAFLISLRPDKLLILSAPTFCIATFSAITFAGTLVMLWQTLRNIKPPSLDME